MPEMNSVVAILFTIAVGIALYWACCNEAHLYVRLADQQLLNAQRDIIAAAGRSESAAPSSNDDTFPAEISYTEGGQVKIARRGDSVYDDILATF